MEEFFIFLILCGIALAIAYFFGKKRQIGFAWSFFFCLFLSPIGGFIITMLSRKYYDDAPQPSRAKKVIGWIIIVLFSLSIIGNFITPGDIPPERVPGQLGAIFFAIGFIGLGCYLIDRGKGKGPDPDQSWER